MGRQNLLLLLVLLFTALLPPRVLSQTRAAGGSRMDYNQGESLALLNVLRTDCGGCLNETCYFLLQVDGSYADKRESCLWLTDENNTELFQESCQEQFFITIKKIVNDSRDVLQNRTVMIGAASCSLSNGRVKNFWTSSGDDLPDWMDVPDPGFDGCQFLAVDTSTSTSSISFVLLNETETDLVLCGHKMVQTCTGGEGGGETTTEISVAPNTTMITNTTVTTMTTMSSVQCEKREYEEYEFGPTSTGVTISQNCSTGYKGSIWWTCEEMKEGPPQFRPEIPVFDCIPKWLDELKESFNNTEPLKFVKEMSDLTKHNELEFALGINDVIQLLNDVRMKFLQEGTKVHAMNFTDAALDVTSNILDPKNSKAWSTMLNMMESFGKVLDVAEALGSDFANSSSSSTGTSFGKPYIDLESIEVRNSEPTTFSRGGNRIFLSPQGFPQGSASVGVFYKQLEHIWTNVTLNRDKAPASGIPQVGDQVLNSAVIAMSLYPKVRLEDHLHVTVVLQKNTVDNRTDPVCAFWDSVRWNSSGCSLDAGKTNKTHVVYNCDHLTNFAVLMTINKEVPKIFALELVSIICCGLSMLGLITTIACFLGIRSLRCRRNIITCNLSLTLLMVNFFVLVGLQRTENMIVCHVMAMLLHYFLLSAFVWMLVEGYFLYQMIIVVFSKVFDVPMSLFYAAGYGVPLVIVAVSSATRFGHYAQKDYCWLSTQDGVIWSFVGPLCVLILVNTFIFALTLRTAMKARQKKLDKSTTYQMGWLRGSFSTMCLLGLTWILAFAYFNNDMEFTTYFFSILNGSQGLFIFISNVLINDRNRKTVLRTIRGQKDVHRTMSQGTSSTRTQLSSRSSVQSNGQVSIPRPEVFTDIL